MEMNKYSKHQKNKRDNELEQNSKHFETIHEVE